MNNINNNYYSKPFEKGLSILNLFDAHKETLTLKEISESLQANRSSVYRFVNTLVNLDYLRKDERTKLLSLGPKAYSLGVKLVKGFNLPKIIKPFIDNAHNSLQVTVDSVLLEGENILRLYTRYKKGSLDLPVPNIETGIYCTSLGKAIFAFLSEEEIRSWLNRIRPVQLTKNTIIDKELILDELKQTRARGYSKNNEEFILGYISIAAPLISRMSESPVGAVCFDFSTVQISMEAVEKKYSGPLVQLAKDISWMISTI